MVNEIDLRMNMVEELMKEVQGPRFGVNEVIAFDPWNEYMSGIVIPESWEENKDFSAASPDTEGIVEIEDSVGEDSSGDGYINSSFSSSVLDPRSMIKSFGVSFTIKDPNPKLEICATWGRYFESMNSEKAFWVDGVEVENKKDEEEDEKKYEEKGQYKEREIKEIWKRYSFGEIIEIELDERKLKEDETLKKTLPNKNELVVCKLLKNYETEKEIENKEEDGFVKIYIKRLKMEEDLYTISVYMINNLNYEQKKEDYHADIDKCLFQPSIRIICDKKIETQNIKMLNETEEELDFLYRKNPTIAVGHMCSAIWDKIDYCNKVNLEQLWPDYSLRLKNNPNYEKFLTPDLRTEFMPLYPVTLPNFDLEENDNLTSDDFKAEDLANKSPEEIYNTLIKLHDLYKKWIYENDAEIDGDEELEENYETIAKKMICDEKTALLRIKKGIELIRDNDLVYTSFAFANKTISLQNKWNQEVKNIEKKDKEIKEFKWRPFQIAFFLMNLEDIYDENSNNKETLDLLWIPTGGGKTEAYLGIMAYSIALRRLKAYQNNETGAGTSIISRYTLRLLTVQQFRRTLKMITAAEYLRVGKCEGHIGWRPKYSNVKGDWIYGSTRFSTGLWVGGGVSPLHLVKKGGAMDLLKGEEIKSKYSQGEPAQILKCPVCGSWLSVPESGLNDKINRLHIVVESEADEYTTEDKVKQLFIDHEKIDFIGIEGKNHETGFYTLSFIIHDKFSRKDYDEELICPILKEEEIIRIGSLSEFNIGYFSSLNKIERIQVPDVSGEFDFEIWCTNPECHLNNIEWEEGCPYPFTDKVNYPDGNYKRFILSPFKENSRMPIPAYLIDDHVYNRCPTVIISTADKIARLAFEPKAGAIFGNVNFFNRYYGYNRNGLFPQKVKTGVENYNVEIKPLKAPDLIIQDELHLIDGPLGSLFGLYEAMVSAIIEKQGGNPKYIASTATISNAEKQVDLLFSKKLFQFPPHGLDISNNFFVKDLESEKAWEEDRAGRLYLGIYAPGKGPMTPQVRLWGRMLKVSQDIDEEHSKLKNFWTVVGYYNSIKELGGALALYRDDIKNRLKNITSTEDRRPLNEDDKEELSSRKSSTILPIILDNLERDGLNKKPKYDAIFTTSMFGTGVDISHLSLMIMTSQPKTTGSYIQATGRIGRDKGGLIVDFLKSGRPRDLNHYEMFPSYHSRIYLDVEPVSVSPFSKGCLSRGLGPSIVAFLRNAFDLEVNWTENEAKHSMLNEGSKQDIEYVKNYLKERLNEMENVEDKSIIPILKYLEKCINDWEEVAEALSIDRRWLKFYEYSYDEPQQNVVLGSIAHEYANELKVVYSNAPQSLRDVEETIDFWV